LGQVRLVAEAMLVASFAIALPEFIQVSLDLVRFGKVRLGQVCQARLVWEKRGEVRLG
jgi:hypothetical protein